MGCSSSKLDDEEAVQLCKDRKNFIKKAVEHRTKFASGHVAYIQSLMRVSAALRDYVEGDEPREFLLDSYTTPVKKTSPHFITISPKSFTLENAPNLNSSVRVNYLRAGGNPSVSVEERPQSPETVRVESYHSPVHQFGMGNGMDGFFPMQSPSPPTKFPSFFQYSPQNRPYFPPPSPRTSQWDFFWNPFSSLDYYGYPTRTSLDQSVLDDDTNGLRQVREEEGIPELEEETEHEDFDNHRASRKDGRGKDGVSTSNKEVVIEDDDDDDDGEDDDDEYETDSGAETTDHEAKTPAAEPHIEVSKAQNSATVASSEETAMSSKEAREETPGFIVYVNRRRTSMSEVIKDLEAQFKIICDSANEVSILLEASKAQYSTLNEFTAMKMLNPVALLRSASSRSSSSRFLINFSASSRDEGYESSIDCSEDSCMFPESHQSTLDKLYAWEKKLTQEVKAGERVRIAYEKKCAQLRNHDVRGDDPSSMDKTRAAIRDLHTQTKVSIHSVEAVSKRIETLRDEELQPQLIELVQGISRMWKVMAECHQTQTRILDDAKLLLAGTPSKLSGSKKYTMESPSPEAHRLVRSAANLETELRSWRACFESWITSQRSYIHAITGWLLRCLQYSDPDPSKFPFSPRRSIGAPPMFKICIQWSRFLDSISEVPVLDGLDFFAAGVGSLYAQQLKEGPGRTPVGSKRFRPGMELVEVGMLENKEEDMMMTEEKMAEVSIIRVVCAEMPVAVSSLSKFAIGSAQGYAELLEQWEKTKCPHNLSGGHGM